MAKQLWTSDEDQKIRDGKAEGRSYEEIAAQLPGRTKAGVSLRAFTIGVAKSRDPKASDATTEAKPKGRPKKVAAAAPAQAAAPVTATKTKGRPKKVAAAPAPVAAAAPAPEAAKVRKPRAVKAPAAAPVVAAPAPVAAAPKTNGTNGHRTAASKTPSKGEQFIKLGGFNIGLPDNAQMEIVPGGVRYDLGNGLGITVSAAG